jgi:hypothetical protein
MRSAAGSMRRIASIWLLAQLATFLVAPTALAHAGAAARDCCPGAGPGHVCPMRHAPDAGHGCHIAQVCGTDAGLLALVGVVGILPAPLRPLTLELAPPRVEPTGAALVSRASLPDPPPPRA